MSDVFRDEHAVPATPQELSQRLQEYLSRTECSTECAVLEGDGDDIKIMVTMQLDYQNMYANDKPGFKQRLKRQLLHAACGSEFDRMPADALELLAGKIEIEDVKEGSIIALVVFGAGFLLGLAVGLAVGARNPPVNVQPNVQPAPWIQINCTLQ
ncbi:unnamed protein product [Symbiodinium natans]|uniref:Uncharacterized protein n=1 Tax=Symbiodinium natans TaxID=878477 RepID=A0A812P084_9DINO|nr:unnamed protein product [Symbiodinium natans]